jgi:TolB protein
MRRCLLIVMLAMLWPTVPELPAQESFLRVTAPGNRQLQLAIAQPAPMSGAVQPNPAREVADVFQFDLGLTGLFTVLPTSPAEARSGIRPGEFDFAPWQGAGADLLLKAGYVVSGTNLTLECRLYEVATGKELLAKRYSGALTDLRRIVHTVADETMLALTGERGPFTGKVAFVSTISGSKEIYLMDYDGHQVQRLTSTGSINLNPDFSPSGKEIIYTSYKKGNPDLFRRDLFSGSEARISASKGINITGAYAPDGMRIALAKSKDGNSEIYLITKDGKELARLTNNPAIDVSPAWSPDGRQIAFVSDRLGKPQLFIMDVDGANVRRLTTSGAYNVGPRWSPKGDRLVYCRQSGNGFQIHAINADGTGDVQLTSEGSNEHPRWSPDGRFIVFSSKRGKTEELYVMRADGSGQTRVSRGKGEETHPTWSARW